MIGSKIVEHRCHIVVNFSYFPRAAVIAVFEVRQVNINQTLHQCQAGWRQGGIAIEDEGLVDRLWKMASQLGQGVGGGAQGYPQ